MALVGPVFVDTNIFVAGFLELGPSAAAAKTVLHAASSGRIRRPCTTWHCCLEFFAVTTRLPGECRLSPGDAVWIVQKDIFPVFDVAQLSDSERLDFLDEAVRERVTGGRIYDAHLARIARHAGAKAMITENVRHFSALERFSVAVLDSATAASLL